MITANVVERLCGAVRRSHTAVMLTHNIDFLFVEAVVMPRLRAIGSPQLTIFADAACAAGTYRTQETLVSKLGTRYRVVPIDLGQARRFHSKALFLAGSESAGLAVGSGNTTYGGMSGNKEVWADFIAPGDGGSQIASFRDYLATILSYVPDPAAIQAEVLGLFEAPANQWAASLPGPGGLAWTPNAVPMLEQIAARVGAPPINIDVLSPYFDADGAALARIAELGSGEVRVKLQPRRAGLSKDIAAKLPDRVRLQGIELASEESRHRFIHAKAYVFETIEGTFVAAGSANCSRAALLADSSWGNAELMAISAVDGQEVDDFWSPFVVTDSAPELPDTHPSEDWTFETVELRILSARKDGAALTIHFKSEEALSQLSVQDQSGVSAPARSQAMGRANFDFAANMRSATLFGVAADGRTVTTAPSWVDDERSLRMAPAERILRDKLEECATKGSLLGRDFLQILELFELHVQRDAPHAGVKRASAADETDPAPFSESDIYSDGFARPTADFADGILAGFSEADGLALILSFFRTRDEPIPNRPGTVRPRDQDEVEGEDIEPEAVVRASVDQTELDAQRARFTRLLSRIEAAMQRPGYLVRKADRLAGDVAFLAVLMTKARWDGLLDELSYRTQSLRFLQLFFFGPRGNNGLIPMLLDGLDPADRSALVADMRSPRLSAAMSLWAMQDWDGGGTGLEARQFRLSFAMLASSHRWLCEGGDHSAVMHELEVLAGKLLPASHAGDVFEKWLRWVRDGDALAKLLERLESRPQGDLAKFCLRPNLNAGELAWQKGRGLCLIEENVTRVPKSRAKLRPLDGAAEIRVLAMFVAPLRDVLLADIALGEHVSRHLFDLLFDFQAVPT